MNSTYDHFNLLFKSKWNDIKWFWPVLEEWYYENDKKKFEIDFPKNINPDNKDKFRKIVELVNKDKDTARIFMKVMTIDDDKPEDFSGYSDLCKCHGWIQDIENMFKNADLTSIENYIKYGTRALILELFHRYVWLRYTDNCMMSENQYAPETTSLFFVHSEIEEKITELETTVFDDEKNWNIDGIIKEFVIIISKKFPSKMAKGNIRKLVDEEYNGMNHFLENVSIKVSETIWEWEDLNSPDTLYIAAFRALSDDGIERTKWFSKLFPTFMLLTTNPEGSNIFNINDMLETIESAEESSIGEDIDEEEESIEDLDEENSNEKLSSDTEESSEEDEKEEDDNDDIGIDVSSESTEED